MKPLTIILIALVLTLGVVDYLAWSVSRVPNDAGLAAKNAQLVGEVATLKSANAALKSKMTEALQEMQSLKQSPVVGKTQLATSVAGMP